MRTAVRSYLVGMHNPIIHSATVLVAWIKIYKGLPSIKESICIFVHDIGYLKQTAIDGDDNNHPELGAKMCRLFGPEYFNLCIAHSRDYAKKLKLPLSKLGYADKGSVLIYPNWIFKRLIYLGGEAQEYHRTTKSKKWGYPVQVRLIKADYQRWMDNNVPN
jgi:hypothetical protein